MATELTVIELPDAYETDITVTPVNANHVASDLAGNFFRATGREILWLFNNDVAPQTITVTSQPASRTGRTGDITAASVPAAEHRVFQIFPRDGWESGGFINVVTSDVDILLSVLRGPLQAAG